MSLEEPCALDGKMIDKTDRGVWVLDPADDSGVFLFHDKAEAEEWARQHYTFDDFNDWVYEQNQLNIGK